MIAPPPPAAVSIPTAAEVAPPDVSEVVVRAPRLPDAAGDLAYSTAVVDGGRLRDARELDDALKTVPGFSLFRRTSTLGANPTTQGASLRAIAGSGSSRALVTLDGVPQNDPFGGWVIWTALDPSAIGAATLVRGAGAGPYGAGALTGVIRLEARDDLKGAEAAVSGGSLDQRRGDGTVGGEVGGARVLLNAAGQESGGWIPVREGRGAADRPLDLHAWSAAARLERDVGAATVAARVSGYGEDRGAGLVGSSSRATGAQASLTAAAQPAPDRWGWRLQGWAAASDLYNATASPSLDRNGSTPANVQDSTPALGFGLNAAARRAAGAFSLELGGDLRAATGETRERFAYAAGAFANTRKAGGQTLVAGLYAEATDTLAGWLLTGGVRLDRWSDMSGERVERRLATGALLLDSRPADQDGVVPTGRFGVRRPLGGGWAWRAAGYAGFRPATLNELHRPFRVGANLTEANPALTPERLYGAETGFDLDAEGAPGTGGGRLHAAADVFYNRLEDAITNVTVGQGPATFPIAGFVPAGGLLRQRMNAGAVDALGLEAEARWSLPGDRAALSGALAWTRSTVDGGAQAPQLNGRRPALTPALTVTAGLDWRLAAPLTATLGARYESARFDDDLNTLKLRAALVVDARLDWRVRPGAVFFLAVDNLGDEAVRTAETANGVYSYDAPRAVRAGLRLTR